VFGSYPTDTGWRWGIYSKTKEVSSEQAPYGIIHAELNYVLGGTDKPMCTATIPDGKWHHWAYVWLNTSTVQFYRDGEIVCQRYFEKGGNCSNPDTGTPLRCNEIDNPLKNTWSDFFYLGENPNWGFSFLGEMDDFQYWQKGLSTDEVRRYMHQPPDPEDVDLVLHYTFDECEGTVVYDATRKWNGTLGNNFKDMPTLDTSPLYSDSAALVYGRSRPGRRVTCDLVDGAYSKLGWSAGYLKAVWRDCSFAAIWP